MRFEDWLNQMSSVLPSTTPSPQIRGTTKYHLSPHEQKAFAGVFSVGLPNTLWRIRYRP